MLDLRIPSPKGWLEAVLANFDTFLQDHASCERKASASALQFVSHYPDRPALVEALIDLALEELEHYRAVYRLLQRRNLQLGADIKDPYVRTLAAACRQGSDVYFMDRLILAGIIEARGCERFGLIADALPAGELQAFYQEITASEARHHGLFLRLARTYFPQDAVETRKEALLDQEAELLLKLPFRAALH